MKWVRDTEYPISNDIMDPDSLQHVSLYTLFPLLTSRYIREQQDVDLNEIPLRSSSRESVKPIRYVEDLPKIKPSKLSLRLSEVRKWMDSQCVGKEADGGSFGSNRRIPLRAVIVTERHLCGCDVSPYALRSERRIAYPRAISL